MSHRYVQYISTSILCKQIDFVILYYSHVTIFFGENVELIRRGTQPEIKREFRAGMLVEIPPVMENMRVRNGVEPADLTNLRRIQAGSSIIIS